MNFKVLGTWGFQKNWITNIIWTKWTNKNILLFHVIFINRIAPDFLAKRLNCGSPHEIRRSCRKTKICSFFIKQNYHLLVCSFWTKFVDLALGVTGRCQYLLRWLNQGNRIGFSDLMTFQSCLPLKILKNMTCSWSLESFCWFRMETEYNPEIQYVSGTPI